MRSLHFAPGSDTPHCLWSAKVAKIICVAGPYHGQKAEETQDSAGRIVLEGRYGQVEYLLRNRPAPNVAIYVAMGATEQDILRGLTDLVPA
jgi:hypothetical protein